MKVNEVKKEILEILNAVDQEEGIKVFPMEEWGCVVNERFELIIKIYMFKEEIQKLSNLIHKLNGFKCPPKEKAINYEFGGKKYKYIKEIVSMNYSIVIGLLNE